MTERASRLRELLKAPELTFLMEAHSGLSAKIAEEAGFPALWASGLAISASMGVRDSNEASWTQVLEVAEFMADATSVPILLDGDTGFGDFNNVRRIVRKLGQRGVAGVCIEDKRFPKRNSFVRDAAHPLAEVEEFCGKLRAGRDAGDDAFVIVARTEALIAGCGVPEALRRAEAYHAAGADAILVHSRARDPDEVFGFLDAWDDRAPVVLVPTTYFTTPTDAFRERGASAVIWANHLLRAGIRGMQDAATRIARDESVAGVDDRIAPLAEVFRLQGDEELREAERLYRSDAKGHAAVILAATRGEALGELTEGGPKTLLRVGGRPILERAIEAVRGRGVADVTVVGGYRVDAVRAAVANDSRVKVVENADFASTGEVASLDRGVRDGDGPALVLFGDVVFKPYFVDLLLGEPGDVVIVVDSAAGRPTDGRASDYVTATAADAADGTAAGSPRLVRAWTGPWSEEAHGEWPGLMRLSRAGADAARRWIDARRDEAGFDALQVTDLLNGLAEEVGVAVVYVRGHWSDVDRLADLERAEGW